MNRRSERRPDNALTARRDTKQGRQSSGRTHDARRRMRLRLVAPTAAHPEGVTEHFEPPSFSPPRPDRLTNVPRQLWA